MLRFRWAVFFSVVLAGLLSFSTAVSARSVTSESVHATLGLQWQYASLTRGFKLRSRERFESPQSDGIWMKGLAFNITFQDFFIGGRYSAATFKDWELSATPGFFVQGSGLDVSEVEVAFGYRLARWISPYIGYLRHRQETDSVCVGCVAVVDLAAVGSGLMVNFPLTNSRWGISLKAGYIRGFVVQGGSDHGLSFEAVLSYTGIRMPIVGALGYSFRRFDYPDYEVSCGSGCFRNRDVFEGPTAMIQYLF